MKLRNFLRSWNTHWIKRIMKSNLTLRSWNLQFCKLMTQRLTNSPPPYRNDDWSLTLLRLSKTCQNPWYFCNRCRSSGRKSKSSRKSLYLPLKRRGRSPLMKNINQLVWEHQISRCGYFLCLRALSHSLARFLGTFISYLQ